MAFAQAAYLFAPLLVASALSAIVLAIVLHPTVSLIGYLVGARNSAR